MVSRLAKFLLDPKKGKNMKTKISVLLAVCLFLCPTACKSPAGPSDTSTAVSPPKSGEWTASTAFGSFDYIVNSASTYVAKITFNFSNWRGRSGSVGISRDPGWPISSRSFKIETSITSDQWTVDGTFDNSGNKASGNWKAVIGTQTESGTWQASPKS
jgi:hypothetical protein